MFEHRSEKHPLNARNGKGETPLTTACVHGQLEAVKWLVEHGANTGLAGEGGLPVETAERWGHFEVFEFLVEKGSYEKDKLARIFKHNGENRTLEILRRHGINVRKRSMSPLFCI